MNFKACCICLLSKFKAYEFDCINYFMYIMYNELQLFN